MKSGFALALLVTLASTSALAQQRPAGGGAAPAAAAPATPSTGSGGTTGLRGLAPVANPPLLTLDHAFSQAVEHSFDLRIANARVDESQAQVKKAWSAILPQVSAGLQYTYNYPESSLSLTSKQQLDSQALLFESLAQITAGAAAQNPDPAQQRAGLERAAQLTAAAKQITASESQALKPIVITPANEVDGQVQFAVPLFNGRALPLLQNAYAGVDITKLSLRSARASVIYGVARSYYQVVAAKRIVDISKEQVQSSTAHRDLAKQRVDEGLSTPLALQRAELDLARAQQSLLSANGALRLAKGSLGGLVGVTSDFDVAEPPAVPALEQGKSADELLRRAVDARDDLRLEKQALGIADHNKTDAWMRFLPTLSFTASGRYTSNTSGLVTDPFTGALGLALSVPIFDGGLTLATMDESDAKLRQEVMKVGQLQQTIEDEVRGTLDDVQLKAAAVETAERVAELARAQKANVDDLFNAGAATALDVSDASLAQFQSDVDAARSRFDLQTARLGLAYAIGELRPDEQLNPTPLADDEEQKARAFVEPAKDVP
ncbi:MAG TPA: TolC family protein [Myxococcota bacterium]